MKLSHCSWFVIFGCAAPLWAVACGDGEGSSLGDSSGGSAGSPSGGASSSGGSSAGTPGSGGESSGGTNAGGDGSGGDGSAGSSPGGAAGSPGTTAILCQEECQDADDCAETFSCEEGRCVAAPACTGNDQCIAGASGWVTECANDAACLPSFACVEIGEDQGRCATEPNGVVTCESLNMEEIEQPRMTGGGTVVVCGNPNSECRSGACVTPCSEDSCPANFECNDQTGECECSNDDACSNLPNVSVCVGGRCECAGDGDCAENANKCYDGVCGCTEASVCTGDTAHPGTEWVCEAP